MGPGGEEVAGLATYLSDPAVKGARFLADCLNHPGLAVPSLDILETDVYRKNLGTQTHRMPTNAAGVRDVACLLSNRNWAIGRFPCSGTDRRTAKVNNRWFTSTGSQ